MGEFWKSHWADVANVVGFALTLYGLWHTFKAAEKAERAASAALAKINHFDALIELSKAIDTMSHIMDGHRRNEWNRLPQRYTDVRNSLVKIKSINGLVGAGQQTAIAGVLQQLISIETRIEACVQSGNGPPSKKALELIEIIKSQNDKLNTILAELRQGHRS